MESVFCRVSCWRDRVTSYTPRDEVSYLRTLRVVHWTVFNVGGIIIRPHNVSAVVASQGYAADKDMLSRAIGFSKDAPLCSPDCPHATENTAAQK